jgi:spermidine synthase
MPRPRLFLEIALVCLAAILLEVSYTRVFSYKLVYYFTYVIIGLALLGLGAGGVLVALLPGLRRATPARLLPVLALLGGVAILGGYFVVARVQLNAFDLIQDAFGGEPRFLVELARLVLLCVVLFLPFLVAGIAVSVILVSDPERVGRLYASDLLGAGVGCGLAVPLMATIGPPGCVLLAGAILTASGLRLAATYARGLVLPLAAVAIAGAGAALFATRLPDVVPDRLKTMSPQNHPQTVFSRWSPVFRVDLLDSEFVRSVGLLLSHDGMWGAVLPRYDGNPASLVRYDADERSIPFRVLAPRPRVAIIGAAGGNEILASLHFDAAHVTAVELNPVTVSLVREHFKDHIGRVAEDPRVTLLNAEGRSFFMRTPERFDLVWFVAPDSYAAMNAATSGAFVLSESYLYTAEMLEESLRHLTDDGIVCAQFGEVNFGEKPNRTARYLVTAREALRRFGVEDFPRHVLVATSPGFAFTISSIFVKRTPFTADEVQRFTAAVAGVKDAQVRYPAAEATGHPVEAVIASSPEELQAWHRRYPFDVRPVTDDAPFFWHFVPFRSALRLGGGPVAPSSVEEGMGERLLLMLLAVVSIFAAIVLVAPLWLRRDVWRAIPHKRHAALYFAALGLGFMFLEVSLIQRLTLFLGYPTYSLSVTLFAILVSTGIGSALSERAASDHRRTLTRLLGVLGVLVVFYLLVLPPLTRAAIGWPLPARIVLTTGVLAPLGLCLGMFMPIGLRCVAALGPHGGEYVAWAWAVNGFCSVVASILSTVCSMAFGFDAVMLIAVGIYAVGVLALRRVPSVEARASASAAA